MKIIDKLNINQESRIYLTGASFTIIAMFIVMAVLFLWIISNNLNIIMTQPGDETYTYFISIMDRVLAFTTILIIIPLSIYQIFAKNKSQVDRTVSLTAFILIFVLCIIFFGGEYFYFNKYSEGELSYSKMFCTPTIETKTFDKIILKNSAQIPQMCVERPKNLIK